MAQIILNILYVIYGGCCVALLVLWVMMYRLDREIDEAKRNKQ